jgi:hypothetical protein
MPRLTTDELDRLANELLSALEIREARLLNWGFINGAQALDDLDRELPELLRPMCNNSAELAELWARGQAEGIDASALLDNLLKRKLIFKPGSRYRTRFAETVRSLFLLRQRFSPDDWRTGERLVGDMKVLLQRRRYPRRDVAPVDLWRELAPLSPQSVAGRAMDALLQEHGETLQLARFQAQAVARILRDLASGEDSAVVIGAGTGAGKTKAFYIPALAHIAANLGPERAVQALAIYPRKELLKDQLRETYAEARKLDALLLGAGRRPVVLGAYYGDVPADADDLLQGRRDAWRRTRDRLGWLCPYVTCPACHEQTMAWPADDLQQEAVDNRRGVYGGHARLVCQQCGEQIGPDRLLLTRRQMLQSPPDILFTTTEMLNRRLSNAGEHALFGIDCPAPPRLVLMDEIHLNEGIHGAQVAYLLRRWQHARGRQPGRGLVIVGLSATVTQAESFFARLTGIPSRRVTYITPTEADLVKEGIEYNLVLKGDPLSGTTLLSTSVRTAMLLCRVLDPARDGVSRGAYGKRAFAFSDKLDVINRWYHIEKEVENPVEPYCRYLYVANNDPTSRQRYEQGQNWWFVPQIHGAPTVLTSGLRLDITSSQYAGVDDTADLVIASSTLEVGYNDPTVGAIIQHKAPFSRAAFIQRKGRAGRPRTMRPWMILVASAYGHDRWAFQHAESLFDPVLPPLDLPLENYYVQKIQASYALMDWLALELKRRGRVESVWRLLTATENARDPRLAPGRTALAGILRELLEDEQALAALRAHLQAALRLPADQGYTVNTLLWGEPRPLVLEVIPALLRQVETSWQSVGRDPAGNWTAAAWTDQPADRPLPDFVPQALFNDLKSPDVLLQIPESRPPRGELVRIRARETLGLALALSEYVPGKVNKRFARKDKIRESHWLELPEAAAGPEPSIELGAMSLAAFPLPEPVAVDGVAHQVYCPYEIALSCVPRSVRPTSTASFVWRSDFAPRSRYRAAGAADCDDGCGLPIPLRLQRASPWDGLIDEVRVYGQGQGAWVQVTRVATGVQVSTRYETGYEHRGVYRFAAEGRPAALGFAVDADALRFTYRPLSAESLRASARWPDLYRTLGSQFLLHLLRSDARTGPLQLGGLEVEWLWQVALSMITRVAVEQQVSLPEALALLQRDYRTQASGVLAILFRNRPADERAGSAEAVPRDEDAAAEPGASEGDGTAVQADAATGAPERTAAPAPAEAEDESGLERVDAGWLQGRLMALLEMPDVQAMLAEHLPVLWDDAHPELDAWLGSVYARSLGAVILSALLSLAPEVQGDDVHLDVDEAEGAIWVSEAAAGGVGLVARLADALARQPRRFEMLLARAVAHCHREELAGHLDRIAALIGAGDAELASSFAAMRSAIDLPRIEDTRRSLGRVLDRHGVPATRSLSMALNAKFLRPSSSADTDELLAALVAFWERESTRLGCAIDLRVIAVAAAGAPEIRDRVAAVLSRVSGSPAMGGGAVDSAPQVYNLLQSLLWLDCRDACPDCIEFGQRYGGGPRPSRGLLAALLSPQTEAIPFGAEGWLAALQSALARSFEAELTCTDQQAPACRSALVELLAAPVDIEYQALYAQVESAARRAGGWTLRIVLSELVGG